jgi:hypothetical protein
MQRWKPKPAPGLWIGLLLLIIVLGSTAITGTRLFQVFVLPPEQWPINLELYGHFMTICILLILGIFLTYRVLASLTLSYEMDRNGVYVLWLGNRAVIPMEEIVLVVIGDRHTRIPWRVLQSIGYYWGTGYTSEEQRLHLFSTRSPAKSLLIHTATSSYAISPNEQDGFVQQLEQRRRLGATKPLAPSYQRGRLVFYAFWTDRVVLWAFLLALGLNLILLGIVFAQYPSLSTYVQMRFNAAGQGIELRPRHELLFLPLAAFGLILVNTALGMALYTHEQTGARVLQIASILMPILFGIAVFTIIAS